MTNYTFNKKTGMCEFNDIFEIKKDIESGQYTVEVEHQFPNALFPVKRNLPISLNDFWPCDVFVFKGCNDLEPFQSYLIENDLYVYIAFNTETRKIIGYQTEELPDDVRAKGAKDILCSENDVIFTNIFTPAFARKIHDWEKKQQSFGKAIVFGHPIIMNG